MAEIPMYMSNVSEPNNMISGSSPAVPKDKSSLSGCLEEMTKELDNESDLVAKLKDKLLPVLKNPDPKNEPKRDEIPIACTPLVSYLKQLEEKIKHMNEVLYDLTSRVDL